MEKRVCGYMSRTPAPHSFAHVLHTRMRQRPAALAHAGGSDAYDADEPFVCDAELRLVKLDCAALPADKHVAVVPCDSDGISIGRDRIYTPRIRIPVMEVSKHHANMFCDVSTATGPDVQPDFFVTDTGSTHGTFVHRRPLESLPIGTADLARIADSEFVRLSPPRHASTPYRLEHLDIVRFGPHAFEVHLHWPPRECDVCAAAHDEMIDLDTAARPAAQPQATGVFARSARERKQMVERERRERLDAIRQSYGPAEKRRKGAYRDRAAVRRSIPAPRAPPPAPVPQEAPPSVGYKLLAKMGGATGGDVPLPRVASGRAGLGSMALVAVDEHAAAVNAREAGDSRAAQHAYRRRGDASTKRRYDEAT